MVRRKTTGTKIPPWALVALPGTEFETIPAVRMLKIDTSTPNGTEIVVALAGRIRREHLAELERVVAQSLAAGRRISLDLRNVGLVDREAVDFFAAGPGRFAALRSCPTYLRKWLRALGRDAS
jgi:hypothetical protein